MSYSEYKKKRDTKETSNGINMKRDASTESYSKYKAQKSSDNSGIKSKSGTSWSQGMSVSEYMKAKTIGFDTLQNDLSAVGKTIADSYNGWQSAETMKNTRSVIEGMRNRLVKYEEYRKQYGGADMSELAGTYQSVLDGWDALSELYGRADSAEAYDVLCQRAEEEAARRASMSSDNLDELQTEIDGLEDVFDTISKYQREIENHKRNAAQWAHRNASLGYDGGYGKKAEETQKELDKFLEESGYGSIDEIAGLIADKRKYKYEAQKVQDNNRIIETLQQDTNFDAYAEMGREIAEQRYRGSQFTDLWESQIYRYGTNEQKENYYALLGKAYGDNPDVQAYLDNYIPVPTGMVDLTDVHSYAKSIEDSLASAEADEIVAKNDTLLKKILYSIPAGIEQWQKGSVADMFRSDEYFAPTASEIAERQMMEDMPTWARHAFNLGKTTANMLPSIGASTLAGVFSGGLGTVAGLTTMGSSVIGNSYQEKINAGWTEGSARTYASITGAAEMGLQYLIGSIGNFSGKLTNKSIKAIANGIDNAAARFAVQYGVSVAGEGIEEALQEIISPFIENLALGYSKNNLSDVEWEEAAYSGMMGVLTAGLLGGGNVTNTFAENASAEHTGARIRETWGADYAARVVFDITEASPEGSDANRLYNTYTKRGITAESASDLQVGRLYDMAEAGVHETLGKSRGKLSKDDILEMSGAWKRGQALSALVKENPAKQRDTDGVSGIKTSTTSREVEDIKIEPVAWKSDKESGHPINAVGSKQSIPYENIFVNGYDRKQQLQAWAETMLEDEAKIFLEQDDGVSNVDDYAASFNLAVSYAKNNFTQDTLLENRGTLSEEQVSGIYSATVKAQAIAKENARRELSQRQGKTLFDQGVFDDSIIDYDGTSKDKGKVNWKKLTPRQREAIRFLQKFSQATGVNIRLIQSAVVDATAEDGTTYKKRVGENGSYNQATNTIEIDVYAGIIDASTISDSIIPTLSHEITHWAKEKAPVLYEALRSEVLPLLAKKAGVTTEALIEAEMNRMKAQHPDMEVTPEKAIDELIARGCEDMLANSKTMRDILSRMSKEEQKSFKAKVEEFFKNLLDWVNNLMAQYQSNSPEAKALREYKKEVQKISKLWDEMVATAIEANQTLQNAEAETALDDIIDDVQFSEREIIGLSGKSYGMGVYLDSNLLTGLAEDERVQKVKDIVKKLGNSKLVAYDKDGNAVNIRIAASNQRFKNAKGKSVPVNKDMTSYLSSIKQEAIVLVDELVRSAKYKQSEPSSRSHDWVDNSGRNKWDYWTVFIQEKNKAVWEATLNVANTKNGKKYLYDIYPIKMMEQSVTSDTSTIDNSIPNSDENVKKNFSDRETETLYNKMGETSRLIKENEKLKANVAYTDQEYQAYGWARENGILTADQNADYRSKFAMAKSGQAKFPKSKKGEYIIPVSDIYDSDKEGINNVLVFAKGTIDKPVITSIIEIYEYDETKLDRVRRNIYDSERRGSEPEAGELFGRYFASDFKFRSTQGVFSQSNGYRGDNGYGGRGGREASGAEKGIGRKNEKVIDRQFSDRETETLYDRMGETSRLIKENEKLKADVARLQERLKLEKTATNGTRLNRNKLETIAGHLRRIADSTYDKSELTELLDEVYTYIVTEENLSWEDVYTRCYEVAQRLAENAKPIKQSNDYAKLVMRDIRNQKVYINNNVLQETRSNLGRSWRGMFMGKLNISSTDASATPLDVAWAEWSQRYPGIFDGEVVSEAQPTRFLEIWDSLKEASESVVEYDAEENARWLVQEVYDQFWNASAVETTVDKYEKRIKELKLEHRRAMKELRDSYNERLQKQKDAAKERYAKLIKKIRDQKDKEIAAAKRAGAERISNYRENAERKTRIQSITKKALALGKKLTKNSKNYHIPEVMKPTVVNFINAIDFSSKRYLNGGEPTKADASLLKALQGIKEMVAHAKDGSQEGLVSLYGLDLDQEMTHLVEQVQDLTLVYGDNEFVLQKMSLADLRDLDRIAEIIQHTVSQVNDFYVARYRAGIKSLAQSAIKEMEGFGEYQEFANKNVQAFSNILSWEASNPYYAFRRYGEAGKIIFEALQDGWDKFAFHIKQIEDFTAGVYKAEEMKKWREEVKSFTLVNPVTGKKTVLKMTVPQIMSLYCLQKREQAIKHILEGGFRPGNFAKGIKGLFAKEEAKVDGVNVTAEDIAMICGNLSKRQKAVADALQKFMNITCKDWGNDISQARFGYNAFEEPNYFPLHTDKNNIDTKAVDGDSGNSLFALLNKSFTKELTIGANNRIIINDIFDVFAAHSSDMAQYNALALPVLDAVRWFNYTENTTEQQRYEDLKDKKIQPQTVEIADGFDIDFDFLENNIKSVVEAPLINKLQELGCLKKYKTDKIDVEFSLYGKGVKKSLHSQENFYGGSKADFAKVILNIQRLLDNSVLLDVHADKAKGTDKENPQLKNVYVLFSAMQEDGTITPVQFEIKEYINNDNRLYLAVALTKIETSVKGTVVSGNRKLPVLLPVSEISIADIFAKINPSDKNFLKYIPDQFLDWRQLAAKNRALAMEREKYAKADAAGKRSQEYRAFGTNGVKQSMEKAFGKEGLDYFTTLLRDINGRHSLDRRLGTKALIKGLMKNAKTAMVGGNSRVVALQGTAYARAAAVIDDKYLTKAVIHKPKIALAKKWCGMALWKSLGYFDINVARSLTKRITHAETKRDKLIDSSLKGAEKADEITWGYLWNACELEVRDTRKDLKVGTDEFYQTIAKRLRDVIYATQVVDSPLTRSHLMRSKNDLTSQITSFMSEATISYNMLQDEALTWSRDARGMGKAAAFKIHGKLFARKLVVYTVQNAIAALLESAWDVLRDDEDEEMDFERFLKLYLHNFALDMALMNKVPFLKDVISTIQGYSSEPIYNQGIISAIYAARGAIKNFQGEGNVRTTVSNCVKAISYLSGIGFYNACRDAIAVATKINLFTYEEINDFWNQMLPEED